MLKLNNIFKLILPLLLAALLINPVFAAPIEPGGNVYPENSNGGSGTYGINNNYGNSGSDTNNGSINFNLGQAGKDYIPHASTGDYETNFWSWVSSLLSVLMPIAGLLVLAYLIWGGIEWITSDGDSGKLQKARNKMMHAVLGMIVLAATLAIFALLQQFLGICIIKLGGSCAVAN